MDKKIKTYTFFLSRVLFTTVILFSVPLEGNIFVQGNTRGEQKSEQSDVCVFLTLCINGPFPGREDINRAHIDAGDNAEANFEVNMFNNLMRA